MKTPTIAEIAAHNARTGGHYFDRDTLRFFRQTRRDFRARTLADGRVVVYAYAHRCWDGLDFGGKPSSLAVYDPETGDVSTPADKEELRDQLTRD
jgi:hypothetical protein